MIDYRIYLVTDDPSRYAGDWLENVRSAVEGGVTCVQYRDTESAPRVQYERICRLRDALAAFKTPIIVNNDAELARAVKAEGVHVGQKDRPVDEVRKVVGSTCEIGLSITALSQLSTLNPQLSTLNPQLSTLNAQLSTLNSQPDCLGIGPVFDARKTKADASEAMEIAGFKAIVSSLTQCECHLPYVAIGGINLENASDVLDAGAKGLAVVSAFSKAEDPYEVAKRFALLFNNRGL